MAARDMIATRPEAAAYSPTAPIAAEGANPG
jgi:hypothetical protein